MSWNATFAYVLSRKSFRHAPYIENCYNVNTIHVRYSRACGVRIKSYVKKIVRHRYDR